MFRIAVGFQEFSTRFHENWITMWKFNDSYIKQFSRPLLKLWFTSWINNIFF